MPDTFPDQVLVSSSQQLHRIGVTCRISWPVLFWRFLAVVATLQLFVGIDEHIGLIAIEGVGLV